MSATPRDCLVDPAAFGRSRSVGWVITQTARATALSAAAQLQHVSAVHVRLFLRTEDRTQGWLASILGWRRERLSRVLGGQAWVSLADLEEMLHACRSSVAGVIWMSTRVEDRASPARHIVASYLRDQLHRLEPDAVQVQR